MDWEFRVSRFKLLHLEWISNEILLYSTGETIFSHLWWNMMEHTYLYMYVWLGHFAVQQKLIEHCKSSINKIFKKEIHVYGTLFQETVNLYMYIRSVFLEACLSLKSLFLLFFREAKCVCASKIFQYVSGFFFSFFFWEGLPYVKVEKIIFFLNLLLLLEFILVY